MRPEGTFCAVQIFILRQYAASAHGCRWISATVRQLFRRTVIYWLFCAVA